MEISFYQYRTYPEMADANPTFGIAPDWMNQGIYYSDDHIRFFSDVDRKKGLIDNGKVGEYYSYFQWLPISILKHQI